MIESEDCSLLHINAGSATPDYMAYQYKYDSVHKRFPGTIEMKKEGDKEYLVVNGNPIVVYLRTYFSPFAN